MSLLKRSTKYTSIPYGDGAQPYVTVDIRTKEIRLLRKVPFVSDALNLISSTTGFIGGFASSFLGEGNLLSNSLLRVSRAAIDVNRIGNFIIDPLKGPMFLIQQQGMQLMNTRPNLGSNGTGAQLYNPLSTIEQTALQGIGGHIRRTVDSPLFNVVDKVSSLLNDLGVTNNLNNLSEDTYEKLYFNKTDAFGPNSAILRLHNRKYEGEPSFKSNLYSYNGGPNSILGIGQTTIKRYYNTLLEKDNKPELQNGFISEAPEQNNGLVNPRVPFNIVNKIQGAVTTWNDSPSGLSYSNYLGDVIKVSSKSWSKLNRETRIGNGRQDSINLTPIFKTNSDNFNFITISGKKYNVSDLAKFRIEAVNANNPLGDTNWMVFRAYLSNFSDSYTSDWSYTRYIGRGENLYTYNGFYRSVSIGFKVAALSEDEMIPMYQKLNYLASNMAPNYNNNIMRGNLMRMTVGNYLYRQPGIIVALTYDIPNDSPWEIAMNESERDGNGNIIAQKRVLYELPHIINVELTFIPIGVGKNAILPERGTSKPFILYKPKEADPAENIWLTNNNIDGSNGPLKSTKGEVSVDSAGAINGNK
jgi:hypothetical protein